MTADSVCELARQIAPANVTIEYAKTATIAQGFYVKSPAFDELTPNINNPNK
jgi:hypothetical protein